MPDDMKKCPRCGWVDYAAPAKPQPEPVAWRWQVHGIYHYSGGFPVSGAEPLYLRPDGAK